MRIQVYHNIGKTGNLNVHFSRQGIGKKYLKYVFTEGIYLQHREFLNFEKLKDVTGL